MSINVIGFSIGCFLLSLLAHIIHLVTLAVTQSRAATLRTACQLPATMATLVCPFQPVFSCSLKEEGKKREVLERASREWASGSDLSIYANHFATGRCVVPG